MEKLIFTKDVSPEMLKYLINIGSLPVIYATWVDHKLNRIRKSPLVLTNDRNFYYKDIELIEISSYVDMECIRGSIWKQLLSWLFYYETS